MAQGQKNLVISSVCNAQTPILLPTASSVPVFSFIAVDGDAINGQHIDECAKLFSANYGVWGKAAGPPLSGKRVRMSATKLQNQCLSIPQSSVLAACYSDATLVGHAFASVWKSDGGTVGWVTQLVVHSTVRRRYIATQLLQTLKRHRLFKDVTAVGLVSSHPASVTALAKYSNVPVNKIDLDFITKNAAKILDASPVDYLKHLKPSGTLFEEDCTTGNVSSLCTQFFVDHREPLDALNVFKANDRWCLGELPEGHEFLIIVPVTN